MIEKATSGRKKRPGANRQAAPGPTRSPVPEGKQRQYSIKKEAEAPSTGQRKPGQQPEQASPRPTAPRSHAGHNRTRRGQGPEASAGQGQGQANRDRATATGQHPARQDRRTQAQGKSQVRSHRARPNKHLARTGGEQRQHGAPPREKANERSRSQRRSPQANGPRATQARAALPPFPRACPLPGATGPGILGPAVAQAATLPHPSFCGPTNPPGGGPGLNVINRPPLLRSAGPSAAGPDSRPSISPPSALWLPRSARRSVSCETLASSATFRASVAGGPRRLTPGRHTATTAHPPALAPPSNEPRRPEEDGGHQRRRSTGQPQARPLPAGQTRASVQQAAAHRARYVAAASRSAGRGPRPGPPRSRAGQAGQRAEGGCPEKAARRARLGLVCIAPLLCKPACRGRDLRRCCRAVITSGDVGKMEGRRSSLIENVIDRPFSRMQSSSRQNRSLYPCRL